MPLIRTPEGVAVLRDWQPGLIGTAYRKPQSCLGEGATVIQDLLLRRPARKLPEPRPVEVSPQLEKLVQFLRN